MGEAIYTQLFFFADHSSLIKSEYQNRIKEYLFCKNFSCSPYPSLLDTPADIVDDFLIIDEEYNKCMNKKQEDKNNA